MDVIRNGTRPTGKANPEYFTGAVFQDPIISATEPARLRAVRVTFTPGARTAWHTHPLGQTLYVVSGVGRVQKQGQPPIEIRAGDSVWIAPGEVHWHGAAPDTMMVHIAMQEALDGTYADWLEQVSDEDYLAAPAT
ncbi:MAG: cupin domain-containing protein [Hyphomicrobiaceae bacterium]